MRTKSKADNAHSKEHTKDPQKMDYGENKSWTRASAKGMSRNGVKQSMQRKV